MSTLVLARAGGLLASPLGLLIGLALGALGGGGSILAVPALVYVAGQTPQAATATSLVIVAFVSVGGLVDHWRSGRVRVVPGLLFGLAGVGGSVLGSWVNALLDPNLLLLAFAALMLVAAGLMYRRATTRDDDDDEGEDVEAPGGSDGGAATAVQTRSETATDVDVATVARVGAVGTGVGFMTGLFGVGGGFVVVPGLVLALGFAMPAAVGTSLLVIVINAAAALVTRVVTAGGAGAVEWDVALPFTLAGLIGVWLGGRVADRVPADRLTQAFAVLLVALAVGTGIDAALSL